MFENIDRAAAMTTPVLPKEYRQYQTDNLDDAYEQGWMDALDNLKNAPAVSVPQWISVKDRLPCSGQPALVANSALRLVSIAWHDAGSGCWESPVWWFCENSPEITHWMPLPEPPKGENDG